MELNQAKCKVMHLGRNNPRFKYRMGGEELAETEEERDLGVLVHESLKPANEGQTAAKNANRVLGLINKSSITERKYAYPALQVVSPSQTGARSRGVEPVARERH